MVNVHSGLNLEDATGTGSGGIKAFHSLQRTILAVDFLERTTMLASVIGVDEESIGPIQVATSTGAPDHPATEYLGETASWLAAIVQSSDDAIIGKNEDGFITSWNRAAEQLFGYPEADVIGQPITLIVPVDRLAEQATTMVRLAQGELIAHLATTRVHRDGTRLAVSLSISPIRNASGHIIGAVKVCRDMSMRNSIDRALIERTSQQDKLERQAVVSAATEISIAYRAKELAQSYADLEQVAAALQHSEAALRHAKDVAELATVAAQAATAKAEAATARAEAGSGGGWRRKLAICRMPSPSWKNL